MILLKHIHKNKGHLGFSIPKIIINHYINHPIKKTILQNDTNFQLYTTTSSSINSINSNDVKSSVVTPITPDNFATGNIDSTMSNSKLRLKCQHMKFLTKMCKRIHHQNGLPVLPEEMYELLVTLGSRSPYRISFKDLIRLGLTADADSLLQSSLFLADELSVRISRRIIDIDRLPNQAKDNSDVEDINGRYLQSVIDLRDFVNDVLYSLERSNDLHSQLYPTSIKKPSSSEYIVARITPWLPIVVANKLAIPYTDHTRQTTYKASVLIEKGRTRPAVADAFIPEYAGNTNGFPTTPWARHLNNRFIKVLEDLIDRHSDIVVLIARVFKQAARVLSIPPEFHPGVQAFLDRLHYSRVGVRLLVGHHIQLLKHYNIRRIHKPNNKLPSLKLDNSNNKKINLVLSVGEHENVVKEEIANTIRPENDIRNFEDYRKNSNQPFIAKELPQYVGIICTKTDICETILEAAEEATFICERTHGIAPPVKVYRFEEDDPSRICVTNLLESIPDGTEISGAKNNINNNNNKNDDNQLQSIEYNSMVSFQLTYVPVHARHILFELIKNAFSASISAGSSEVSIEVVVHEDKNNRDLTRKNEHEYDYPKDMQHLVDSGLFFIQALGGKTFDPNNPEEVKAREEDLRRFGGDFPLPPRRPNGISVLVIDRGNGIPVAAVEKIFNYAYTTSVLSKSEETFLLGGADPTSTATFVQDFKHKLAPNQHNVASSLHERVVSSLGAISGDSKKSKEDSERLPPMSGLGYGLPLSRLYARFLGGEVTICTKENCGTIAEFWIPSEGCMSSRV